MTQVGRDDIVLVVSLSYLSFDILLEWEGFGNCYQPLHKWLLGSYGLIVCSRLIYVVGTTTSTSNTTGDFLVNTREKGAAPRALMHFTWLVIVPLFIMWSAVGTTWFWQTRTRTPQCLPNDVHLWFFVAWQVSSYLWILIHCGLGVVAWFLEARVRRHEGDLRQIEDADVVSRWGNVSQLHDYTSLPGTQKGDGLTPAEINALPSAVVPGGSEKDEVGCPICQDPIIMGDGVRQLAGCGHTFHKSCIDLWLLRRAACPLCKHTVKAAGVDKGGLGCGCQRRVLPV